MYSQPSSSVAIDDSPGRAVSKSGAILRAELLTKIFSSGPQTIVVLDGVDLEIERGQMISVVGPSGAGKSTLLHLIAALDTPTNGEVYFAGTSLRSLIETELAKYRNRSVGLVWQRHHLLPDFTAAENVAMPLLIQGKPFGWAVAEARTRLAEVGLADRAEELAGRLSGGEQQRVAIARALVHDPKLLLADEPTGDLDERNAEAIFELMQSLHRSHQLTSIFATHNMLLARRADRLLRLEHGKLSAAEEARVNRV